MSQFGPPCVRIVWHENFIDDKARGVQMGETFLRAFKRLLVTFLVAQIGLLTIKTQANSESAPARVQQGIEFIVNLLELPSVLNPDRSVTPSPDTLNLETQEIFYRLVSANFRAAHHFELRPYLGFAAACDVEGRIVYMNPNFERALRSVVPQLEIKDVLAFILAHEIGHYFYEAHVQHHPSKRSALGNTNYIGADPLIHGKQLNIMHGEVDLIGLSLLVKAGFNPRLAPKSLDYLELAIKKMAPGLGIGELEDKPERIAMIKLFFN